ncbi:fibroleukin [Scyliorhinus torazame]|uniref:fibroleukin n=1 Tax=Scyliorhinus torazame TaxID=75743 RepID=UPI003B5A22A4
MLSDCVPMNRPRSQPVHTAMRYSSGIAEAGLRALVWSACVWVTSGLTHNGSNGHGLIQTGFPLYGQHNNLALPSRRCRRRASLRQLENQGCPDVFRSWDQVSDWLQVNGNSRRQLPGLKEVVSQIQEELRNQEHRMKQLELQVEVKSEKEMSLEARLRQLQQGQSESNTLLHIHASLIYDLQTQVHNLTALLEQARSNSDCSIHQNLTDQHKHPDLQYVRNCPIDCASIYLNGESQSGVYTIVPSIGGFPTRVFCDMDTAGGGWTVIQRRLDGNTDFNRDWREYREGFGDLPAEFWLGNDHIHAVTSQGEYSLRIDLEDWNSRHRFGLYKTFSIEDESNHYRLHVGGFSGSVEDSFAWYHNKRSFSTPDTGNICAKISHGGWWYHQCFFSNLNGVYYKGGRYSGKARKLLGPDGIVWYSWKNSDYYSLKKVSMKIRPRSFRSRQTP